MELIFYNRHSSLMEKIHCLIFGNIFQYFDKRNKLAKKNSWIRIFILAIQCFKGYDQSGLISCCVNSKIHETPLEIVNSLSWNISLHQTLKFGLVDLAIQKYTLVEWKTIMFEVSTNRGGSKITIQSSPVVYLFTAWCSVIGYSESSASNISQNVDRCTP